MVRRLVKQIRNKNKKMKSFYGPFILYSRLLPIFKKWQDVRLNQIPPAEYIVIRYISELALSAMKVA
ncbi:hypothetical protein EDM56_04535 [Brevibacillus fluminis]|uniref:Uncharacterized protein n=1 Tax=Brevibacillus fluminis TaxID=511487 RepID=A0A3M8DVB8_9BACL|nr:hypothetical protein EDM56_04535 [Brevibacillus fluminis]